jgi:DNA-binding XRE family transcriptional regulator
MGPSAREVEVATFTAQLANADRMMTHGEATDAGVEVLFADGRRGTVPFSEIPEIGGIADLQAIEMPNAYVIVLRSRSGESVELPWDYVRHYCDPSYKPRIDNLAAAGRKRLGQRIRRLREAAHLTQEQVASAAGIGRVTLVRLEKGGQSPNYETLVALARAMNRDPAELFGP